MDRRHPSYAYCRKHRGAVSRAPIFVRRIVARLGALQLRVALAVMAAALLDPFQAAIAGTGLVGVVLVETGFAARLAGGILRVFWIDHAGEYGVAGCYWGRSGSGGRRGSSRWRRRGCRGCRGRSRGRVGTAIG